MDGFGGAHLAVCQWLFAQALLPLLFTASLLSAHVNVLTSQELLRTVETLRLTFGDASMCSILNSMVIVRI